MKPKTKNQIRSILAIEGVTMTDAVQLCSEEYGWSESLSSFSDKLSRGSLRYREAVELADVLGYDLVWKKRGGRDALRHHALRQVQGAGDRPH